MVHGQGFNNNGEMLIYLVSTSTSLHNTKVDPGLIKQFKGHKSRPG